MKYRLTRACRPTWVESLEPRIQFADPAVDAYQARAAQVLDGNVATIRNWNTTNASLPAETASVTGISIWTAGAAYARAQTDPTLLPVAHKAAAAILSKEVTSLFVGGNDGWPAWATADTYLRYRSLIQSDPTRYSPANFAVNANSADGKYSLNDLFKYVLTQSYYAPIDSTSNHYLMNATACYLANVAFPGEVVKPFNNSTADPTGSVHILSRAQGIATAGPGEFLSINYGVANWAEFLSIYQLGPANTTITNASRVAFETSLAMNAGYWMNGQVAGPTGRGYPNTGAWGAAAGDTLIWTYLGGDYGQPAQQLAYATDDDVKVFAVLAASAGQTLTHAGAPVAYIPPPSVLNIDDESRPLVIRSNFNGDYQYSYDAGLWSTYSDGFNWNAQGGAAWRTRTIWTKPEHQSYNAVSWAINPGTNAAADANGRWTYVNPDTLETFQLSGSGTYGGGSPFSSQVQNQNTILQGFNIPPRSTGITPGGSYIVRGALIYVPIPKVTATGAEAADGDGWFRPVISADGKRLFVAYNSIFMCYLSTAPISVGTKIGNMQFYNVYGGQQPGQTVDPESYLQFAIAQESFSPSQFPGTTLAEQFANFQTVMNGRVLPEKTKDDTFHPAWRYTDDKATLATEYGSPSRYARDPKTYTRGIADDFISDLGNADPQVIDYDRWPFFEVADTSGARLVSMPSGGNMSLTVPGQPSTYYDFLGWKVYSGSDISLRGSYLPAGGVRLDWNTPTVSVSGFTVQRSTDGNAWATLSTTLAGTATTYTDTTALQETNYFYRVIPAGSPVDANRPVSLTTTFRAPSNLRLSVNTTNNITLTWTNNATGYNAIQLQYSPDGYSQWAWLENYLSTSSNTRSFTHADFTGGERLFYRVLAYGTGPNGTTLFSEPSNVVGTQLSPQFLAGGGNAISMPRLPRARANSAGSQITVNWQDTAYNETGYQVERSTDGGGTWVVLTAALGANTTSFADTTAASGTNYLYRVAARNGAALSPYSAVAAARGGVPNRAPTVAQPATAPAVVTGTSAQVSVLGADDGGEAGLRYAWSVTSGPGAVAFSRTGTNAAKNATATFSRAGTYVLTVNIIDSQGLTTGSAVTVEVRQSPAAVTLTPGRRTLVSGGSVQLACAVNDQFGFAMSAQPSVTWRATAGVVGATGVFTAPAGIGVAAVSASVGALVGTAVVAYEPGPLPVVGYRFDGDPAGVASDWMNNGHDALLGGGATPAAGRFGGGLALNGSSGVATIGSPPALNITGRITLAAWVRPNSATGLQNIVGRSYSTSPQAETVLRINGARYEVGSWNGTTAMAGGGSVSADIGQWVHLAGVYDGTRWTLYRNGVSIGSTTSPIGSLTSAVPWTIGASGINNRFLNGSVDEVRIYDTDLSPAAIASLFAQTAPPTFAGTITTTPIKFDRFGLRVLGASAAGEASLSYTWAVLGTPPGAVSFKSNGTNAAKTTTATFASPGTYTIAVTVNDASGRGAVQTVTLRVPATRRPVASGSPGNGVPQSPGPVPTGGVASRGAAATPVAFNLFSIDSLSVEVSDDLAAGRAMDSVGV
jgi:hypothetical protein